MGHEAPCSPRRAQVLRPHPRRRAAVGRVDVVLHSDRRRRWCRRCRCRAVCAVRWCEPRVGPRAGHGEESRAPSCFHCGMLNQRTVPLRDRRLLRRWNKPARPQRRAIRQQPQLPATAPPRPHLPHRTQSGSHLLPLAPHQALSNLMTTMMTRNCAWCVLGRLGPAVWLCLWLRGVPVPVPVAGVVGRRVWGWLWAGWRLSNTIHQPGTTGDGHVSHGRQLGRAS